MPYTIQTIKLDSPFLDKRVKLLPCHKERIIALYADGYSQRELGRMFKVSKGLIRFVVSPEAYKTSREKRNKKGRAGLYYDRRDSRESTKNHRQNKVEVFNKLGIHITKRKTTKNGRRNTKSD